MLKTHCIKWGRERETEKECARDQTGISDGVGCWLKDLICLILHMDPLKRKEMEEEND